jgi:hypothetical protein
MPLQKPLHAHHKSIQLTLRRPQDQSQTAPPRKPEPILHHVHVEKILQSPILLYVFHARNLRRALIREVNRIQRPPSRDAHPRAPGDRLQVRAERVAERVKGHGDVWRPDLAQADVARVHGQGVVVERARVGERLWGTGVVDGHDVSSAAEGAECQAPAEILPEYAKVGLEAHGGLEATWGEPGGHYFVEDEDRSDLKESALR